MASKKSESVEVEVIEVVRGQIEFCIKGTSPLIFNRYSDKAKRELLMPKGRVTAADKAARLKHNPLEEFRGAAHWLSPPAPTLLALPATAFKGAMMTAALDMPGLHRTSIGRLVFVNGDYISIYGTPKLLMSMVRSSDMKRTPDVRTRVIVPEWCAKVSVTFVKPQHKDKGIINLMAAAGITSGVGDYRPEKGKGSYGQFEIVPASDKAYKSIIKQGRDAQVKAMSEPEPYDDDTRELLDWFLAESKARGWELDKSGKAVKA